MTKDRLLAIYILEGIAGMLADKGLAREKIFDCKNNKVMKPDGTWYDFEDLVVNIIKENKTKKKIRKVKK